jgi:hypothetical protein
MFRILMTVAILLAAAPAAFAQSSDGPGADRPDTEAGRYVLRRVDEGLMRLDRETGATSFCRKRGESWVCEAVADDRIALEDEIARLAGDNAELAREIGRLRDRVATLEGGKRESRDKDLEDDGDTPRSDSPSDAEIDKVMKTFETMMRRFMDMARDLRKDYEEDRF